MSLFVDSAAHIAFLDAHDQYHPAAKDLMLRVLHVPLLTSVPVLSEVATRASKLIGARRVADYIRSLLSRESCRVAPLTHELFMGSLDILIKFEDQGLSFTDCTNVLLMRAAKIDTIFTFDQAFRRIGFRVVP